MAIEQNGTIYYNDITTALNGKANSSHPHLKSDITDFPTSMPASDVYSWAKASSKPSYSWDEITSKPSSFTPANHDHDDRYYTESEVANNFFNVNNTTFGSNYFIFNNNLKICWGTYGQLATSHNSNTVKFPITFDSAPVVTISVNESAGAWDYQEVVIDKIYTTYFTCRSADTQSGKYIRYIAIGY